jgi:alpha-N-arabinofuranosidase
MAGLNPSTSTTMERATVSITTQHTIGPVDRKIYSGFVEHMGRCVYGGLVPATYPEKSTKDDCTKHNFRKDVIQTMKEVKPPLVRYPGGNYTANFNWMDGVGPVRKPRVELAWLKTEPNTFGTNEFIEWCREAEVEPFLCLNMGTGDLREALAWVEYCNSDANSYYANLRRSHGYEKPHKVTYWCLGNEVYGDWQVAQDSKESYAAKAIQWAKAIRLLDPSIKLVLCGQHGYNEWDSYVLNQCIEWVDYHSIHLYTEQKTYEMAVHAPKIAEKCIIWTQSMIDNARFNKKVTKPVKICFDEWNVWNPERYPGIEGHEEIYNVADMLGVAVWFNIFIRHADIVEIACIAQSVNVIAPIYTKEGDLMKQTIWWPYLLAAQNMHGRSIASHVNCSAWQGELTGQLSKFEIMLPELKHLDVASTVDDSSVLTISIVNGKLENVEIDLQVDCEIKHGIEKIEVYGEPSDENSFENKDKVSPIRSNLSASRKVVLKRCSYTMLRYQI